MTSRNYDLILRVANANGFSASNTVIGATSLTVGYIANVDITNNILKVKLANPQQEFSVSETIRSNIITVSSTANGALNTISLPFQADTYSNAITTKSSTITSISPSTFIAEKNAFTQNPITRLYSIYYPGEWYPPNEYGNPSGAGTGYAWPSIFPLRIAEVVGEMDAEVKYKVSYGETNYIPYPVNVSGLEQASDGRVNELSLSLYNVDNLISVLVEDPYLVGTASANSVYGYVNGELVGGIDPRTVPTATTYTDSVATAALKSARAKGLLYDANVVTYYEKEFAPFDKTQAEAIGDTWIAAKSDTRDLLGAAVEIKTTFANFLDYWPEYSIVTEGFANSYTVKNSFPYRIGDTLTTGNDITCNANIVAISSNHALTLSRPIVRQLYIGDKENAIQGIFLRPNGTSIFVVGGGFDNVYKYSMSSSHNVATATLTEGYFVRSIDTDVRGISFSSTGTQMYILGATTDSLHQYSLSTAYSPATATYVANVYIGNVDNAATGVTFNSSGTEFYISGTQSSKIYQYSMATPWDVANATYTSNVTIVGAPTRDLFLSPDGTSLFTVSGASGNRIYQYNLTEAENIVSATLYANAYIGNYEATPTAIAMRSTGKQLYLSGTTSDTIYQMSLSTAWDITTLSNELTIPIGSPLYIVNAQADTESYLQDVYKIDQLEGLSEHVANFSLVSWLQYFKIVTPKRKYYKNTCQWVYKGDECQYPGPGGGLIPGTTLSAPATGIAANNMIMPSTAGDVCAKSLAACTLRNNSLHFGGFPGVGRSLPQM